MRTKKAKTKPAGAKSASTAGLGLTVTPLDDCCFNIKAHGEHIGVWCPASHRVVIDGDVVGFAWSKEEVLDGLELQDVKAWGMRPND